MRKTLSALSLVIGILLADCGISGANIEVNGYNDKEKMARFYKAWKIRGNSYEK